QSVTITNVDDGTNGRSVTNVSQKWRLTTTTATPTQAWSDAGWLTTQPTTTATNKYLWSITRTTFNLAPLTQDVIEQKAVYGDKGDKGDTGNDGRAGKDGVGIKTTVITYASHTNGTTAPTTGYTTTVPSVPAGQFLWTKTVWTYTDNSSETGYSVAMMGLKGDKGDPGNNGTNGIAGKDGKGIKSTAITYQASTNGTTAPTGTWSASVPTVAKGSFLWTRTIWTYTDNTTETGYAVAYMGTNGNNGNDGIAGKDGTGIKTTTITYAVGTSGTSAPASGWNSQVPNVPAGQYLWTKTVWAYTDNTSETGYSVSKFGEKGDRGDRGIQGLQGPDGTQGIPGPKGADGTDAPTITVKSYTYSAGSRAEIELTGPNAFKQTVYNRGHNVWVIDATTHELKEFVSCDTYTAMSFSHNGVSTTLADYLTSLKDSIVVIAASDADAIDQNVRDVLNSMGGFPDFGTWGSWRYGHVFIGMSKRNDGSWPLQPRQGYEEVIKEDGSAPEIGCTLSKGGIVANGADGKTQYTHIAYANSADGWKDFSTSDSNRAYIGMYVNFKIDDSNTPSDYSWTLVKGADGTQGIPGTPGKDGKIPFFHTAWSYSADGKNGFTTSYPNLNLLEGTAQFTGDWGRWRWHGTWDADPYNGHKAVQTNNAWGGPKYVINDLFNRKVVSPNTDYTLSVKIKNTSNDSMDIYFFAPAIGITDRHIIKLPPNSDWTTISATFQFSDVNPNSDHDTMRFEPNSDTPWQQGTIIQTEMKFEPGSIATPYIQSANEVKTADYPSYIGQYTDDKKDDSTNPSDYSWRLIRGNDGKDGAPGKDGRAGNDGNPGKTVSNTEPTTRFKGLTWKYIGMSDLTASDGTVIKPNTEYYYNGTHWVINYFSVNNFAAESITSDKIDGKNLTITDGEFISKTTNGPVTTSTEIKDNHIAISKTDGTVNTRNDIALDSEQGLAQKFTNINTGFYRTAGINYQGPFTSDSDGNYAQLTPQGTKLSTDVPWTKLSLMNNFNGTIEYAIINGTVYISASGVGVPAMTAGQWKQAAQLPTGSSAIPIRANRIAAGDSGDGLSWAILSNQAGGIFIRCSANKAPTPNLFNATLPYPIG
ncbi:MAG: hypothetical protein L0J36_09870, partial [Lactococcus lactis]|nr:hypothetical protein [Lactococcus lactis]